MEDFVPSATVTGVYSCGPTVYSHPHLGNMRAYVFADTLKRALTWKDTPVRHVVNITDVGHAVADSDTGQDKLELAAARELRSVEEIAEHYTRGFMDDSHALNIAPADEYPRASAYVPQMIEFAKRLEEKGFTYQIPSGLYFDTSKSPDYGELALLDLAGQRETGRVEDVENKRNPSDFALWRAEEPGKRRVMRWDSPWGWGAPGWHLECSVMSIELLGDHFDIHTGGIDHRELHHVNEIAQSQAYLDDGKPWVHYWLHNEFLQLNAQKMAKSAGGAPILADLMSKGYHPLAFRLFLLGSHYRSQLDFTYQAMEAAQATLHRLATRVTPLRPLPVADRFELAIKEAGDDATARRLIFELDEAISNDLATPKILAILQEALREPSDGQKVVVAAADALLGLSLDMLDPRELENRRSVNELEPGEQEAIERLVADRTHARQVRDWARADEIRDQLDKLGVQVTDTPEGPVWELRLSRRAGHRAE
jgi:cysteinyl-tRNA synthetase